MSKTYNPSQERKKEIIKLFQKMGEKHSLRKVWESFVIMSAISIASANGTKTQMESRAKTYKTYADQFTEEEVLTFAHILRLIIEDLEHNPDQDLLGEMFMSLGLGNQYKGQFFTPYPVCKAMAAMTFSSDMESFDEDIKEKGYVSVGDPCCGAGALLIAFANHCRENKINFQTSILFAAQDIDLIAGCMCYIQLSLLGCAGYVVIDNSITHPTVTYDEGGLFPKNPEETVWYMPMFRRDIWEQRKALAYLTRLTNIAKEEK